MAQGDWTRASIQRDRERFERKYAEPASGDPFPVGKTPEELGGEPLPGDGWDAYEVNT